MTQRLTSSSTGRGPAWSALVADWAGRNPKIRRVWISERRDDGVAIALEVQPVADSEETLPVWLAHCEKWRHELEARIGRRVDLKHRPGPGEADALVYECAG